MSLKDLRAVDTFSETDYNELLQQTVAVISSSRLQIAKQLNTASIATYWEIGRLLEERKIESKYGDGIIKRLSVDLKSKYPNMGLSPRNLWNMKLFYHRYYEDSINNPYGEKAIYVGEVNDEDILKPVTMYVKSALPYGIVCYSNLLNTDDPVWI